MSKYSPSAILFFAIILFGSCKTDNSSQIDVHRDGESGGQKANPIFEPTNFLTQIDSVTLANVEYQIAALDSDVVCRDKFIRIHEALGILNSRESGRSGFLQCVSANAEKMSSEFEELVLVEVLVDSLIRSGAMSENHLFILTDVGCRSFIFKLIEGRWVLFYQKNCNSLDVQKYVSIRMSEASCPAEVARPEIITLVKQFGIVQNRVFLNTSGDNALDLIALSIDDQQSE